MHRSYILLWLNAVIVVSTLDDDGYEILSDTHRASCLSSYSSCNDDGNASSAGLDTVHMPGKTECCGYCTCDPGCEKHNNCCLSFYGNFNNGERAINTNRYRCVTPQYLTTKETTYYIGKPGVLPVWMIAECDSGISGYYDYTVKQLCADPGSDGSIESLLPVTDNITHYRNKYCGFCNGLTSSMLTHWNVELVCSTMLSFSDKDVLQKIAEKKCNLFYRAPNSVLIESCNVPDYSISTCNETGQWLLYDKSIERACNSFVDPFNFTYKNYFCYVCNTRQPEPYENWTCQGFKDLIDVSPPFTAVLDLGAVKKEHTEIQLKCDNADQFPDYKLMVCRDILCYEDRYLDAQLCHPVPDMLNDICYKLYIKLTGTSHPVRTDTHHLNLLTSVLINTLSIKYSSAEVLQIYEKIATLESNYTLEYLVVEILLKIRNTTTGDARDDLVNLFDESTIQVGETVYASKLGFYSKIGDVEPSLYVADHYNKPADILRPVNMNRIQSGTQNELTCTQNDTLSFNKVQVCAFVQISVNELSMRIIHDFLLIEEAMNKKTFSKWEYERDGDSINICLRDFQSIYGSLPFKKTPTLTPIDDYSYIHPKRILSFVCVCVSVACLLVTIVIYLLYKDLQSQPGMNNIILCVCLLLAQTTYQFGAGQRSLSDWACSLIGAFCHFFWLCVMFAMNACSVKMFLIFKTGIKLSPQFKCMHTLKHIMYVMVPSLAFVAVNVAVSLIRSNGKESGYGGNLCYLSSRLMHAITFMIPTGVTISVNIILFIYVVRKIHISNIASKQMNVERNYFGVYVRLSTLTGLTWTFAFILLLIKSDIIEYLFIIFNAGQGVFIMVAFVLNKRIFSHCFKEKDLTTVSALATAHTTVSGLESVDNTIKEDDFCQRGAEVG